MPDDVVLGWDIGGAHLKVAAVGRRGRVLQVVQLPCPLWLGLEHLDHAISLALAEMPRARLHTVTMTGELTDFFRNRAQGVKTIIARLAMQVPEHRTYVYAGPAGFLTPQNAIQKTGDVASANWAASAQFVASRLPDALFVDIGSTTTDLVPIRGGALGIRGFSDADRLACEELVYTGVVRTPLMALADRIPFDGQWIPAMAEYFATTADVYRLTGELPDGADQLPAADNGGKTVRASARRLARMIGRDLESAPLSKWKECARHLAELQLWQIRQACERVLSKSDVVDRSPVVGAGTGRFVARKLAAQLGRRYRDFDSLIDAAPDAASWASSCAPAVAVAILAQARARKRK
jgi:(4-(4-[2-(gamma-L-glutamylamino)ethyl]phenoxymethyl)furan-2-yl)methanamine synthase